jgi:hypothetical protein
LVNSKFFSKTKYVLYHYSRTEQVFFKNFMIKTIGVGPNYMHIVWLSNTGNDTTVSDFYKRAWKVTSRHTNFWHNKFREKKIKLSWKALRKKQDCFQCNISVCYTRNVCFRRHLKRSAPHKIDYVYLSATTKKWKHTIKVSNKKQPPITEQKWRTL